MKKSLRPYVRIVDAFIILTIIALIVIAHLTLASATIVIPGNIEEMTISIPIIVENTIADRTLYGDFVRRDLEVTKQYPIAATTLEAEKAGGNVTIINNYSQTQTLIATTRLLTPDNKLFRITQTIVIPPGERRVAFAEADTVGDDYLIAPSTFIIPGLWAGIQDKIYAESTDAMTYERLSARTLRQEDVDQALELLSATARTLALEEIQASLASSIQLSNDQIDISNDDYSYLPRVGDEAESFQATLRFTASAFIFEQDQLHALAQRLLLEDLSHPETFIQIKDNGLSYQIDSLSHDDKKALLNVSLSILLSSSTPPENIDIEALRGQSLSQAKEYLDSQGFVDARITLSPFWVRSIPNFVDHITVRAE